VQRWPQPQLVRDRQRSRPEHDLRLPFARTAGRTARERRCSAGGGPTLSPRSQSPPSPPKKAAMHGAARAATAAERPRLSARHACSFSRTCGASAPASAAAFQPSVAYSRRQPAPAQAEPAARADIIKAAPRTRPRFGRVSARSDCLPAVRAYLAGIGVSRTTWRAQLVGCMSVSAAPTSRLRKLSKRIVRAACERRVGDPSARAA